MSVAVAERDIGYIGRTGQSSHPEPTMHWRVLCDQLGDGMYPPL